MNMTTIDYKKVKCPKCGKSYFRVKEDSGINFTNLIFITKPDPIYKDGELQNPTEDEPIKERCECLECGCNFRVETYDIFRDYRFIDEEEELEENKRRLAESFKVLEEETKDTKLKTGTIAVTAPCLDSLIWKKDQRSWKWVKVAYNNMEKSIFDFVELQDYIEEEHEREAVFPTDDLSLAAKIYYMLHSAILFFRKESYMVINLDDVETLKFETEEYKGRTFKFIYITSKYKDSDGSPRISSWEYDNIIKAKQYKV